MPGKDWNRVRPVLESMYMNENQPLADVRKRLEVEFEFIASDRAYKTKFAQWGWRKHRRSRRFRARSSHRAEASMYRLNPGPGVPVMSADVALFPRYGAADSLAATQMVSSWQNVLLNAQPNFSSGATESSSQSSPSPASLLHHDPRSPLLRNTLHVPHLRHHSSPLPESMSRMHSSSPTSAPSRSQAQSFSDYRTSSSMLSGPNLPLDFFQTASPDTYSHPSLDPLLFPPPYPGDVVLASATNDFTSLYAPISSQPSSTVSAPMSIGLSQTSEASSEPINWSRAPLFPMVGSPTASAVSPLSNADFSVQDLPDLTFSSAFSSDPRFLI